jgi:hypothetical protein
VDGPSFAPHPQDVAARYISPNTYGIWTCDRLADEHARVRITASQGSTFLDRMIALVEGAGLPTAYLHHCSCSRARAGGARRRTPGEDPLTKNTPARSVTRLSPKMGLCLIPPSSMSL